MRSDRLYLVDMLEATASVRRFLEGRAEEDLVSDEMLGAAVLQRLTIICEAASRVSTELKDRYPDISWRRIVAFRNIAVHAYFVVDWHTVWLAATENAPALAHQIADVLDREFDQGGQEAPPEKPVGG